MRYFFQAVVSLPFSSGPEKISVLKLGSSRMQIED